MFVMVFFSDMIFYPKTTTRSWYGVNTLFSFLIFTQWYGVITLLCFLYFSACIVWINKFK